MSKLGLKTFHFNFFFFFFLTIFNIIAVPLEMPVLVKEHFNRWYSLRSYYLAITISDLPFQVIYKKKLHLCEYTSYCCKLLFFFFAQAVFCVMYASIVYYLTSQPYEMFRFGMFISACLLISFVAQSVGLVVGAAMNVQVCTYNLECHI